MLSRIEYSVIVPVSSGKAFRAFCNLDRLLGRGIYEEATWIEGVPWKAGSRIRYLLTSPVRATIATVVTALDPPSSVELLNHALGITAEQHVTFTPASEGGTQVRMTMEYIGKSSELARREVERTIGFLTRDALDTMAALCTDDDHRRFGTG